VIVSLFQLAHSQLLILLLISPWCILSLPATEEGEEEEEGEEVEEEEEGEEKELEEEEGMNFFFSPTEDLCPSTTPRRTLRLL